jgi:hypothetical protein
MNLLNLYLSAAVIFSAITGAQPQDRLQSLVVIGAHDERPRKDVRVTCKEGCQPAIFDSDGLGKIKLPAHLQPGDPITLVLRNPKNGREEWVLISPWDGRTTIPRHAAFEISIVVGRKGDRQILGSNQSIEAITAQVLKKVAPKLDRQISDEERRLVLKIQAEAVGLTPEEVDRAIR